ncbi:hypothetical protein [Streptomyces sp. NPDC048644]|uniref:hypothetical protein n=1 Tax=Streptomyces sp. NPDC048644 TaxID=3365582 RepID=UPI00371AC94C
MAQFQLGEVPHGFMINESGGLIHYKYGIVLASPNPNQTPVWGDGYLSFACDWADVRLRVAYHDGGTWTVVKNWDITAAGPRVAEKLPVHVQKISIGRVKKSSTDVVDNAPVDWLLEYV